MRCTNHPDIETQYLCSKDGVYLCQECLMCPNPNIHCKFRTSCIIWEIQMYGEERCSVENNDEVEQKEETGG